MLKNCLLFLSQIFIIAYVYSQKNDVNDDIALYLAKGDSLYYQGQYDDSEVYYNIVDSLYNQIFEVAKNESDYKNIKEIGLIYADYMRRYRLEHSETIRIAKKVLEIAKKTDDTLVQIDAHYNIGVSNYNLNQLINSLKHFEQGLSLLDHEKYSKRAWKFYLSKAEALKTIDRERALRNVRMATKFLQEDAPDYDKADNYKLYTLLMDKSQSDSIEYYAELQYKYMAKEQSYEIVNFVNQLAYHYIKQNQPEKAKKLVDEKIKWCQFNKGFQTCPDPAIIHTIGLIYKIEGNYQEAIRYFSFSHQKFLEYKDYVSLIEVSTDLADTYKQMGNYKMSTEILVPIKSHMDSVAVVNLKREIEKLEIRRTLKNKEKEIGALQEENIASTLTIDKITLYIYLLAIGLIVVIGFAIYRSIKAKVKVHKLSEKITLNRLHNLTSVMNPHFLFNCFSTLQYMILNNETLKANEYMTELSGLIRNILSASDSIYISFTKELEILKSYVNLENERLTNKFIVEYKLDAPLKESDFSIPSMVVQPYVENAIKHGFAEKGKAYKLQIIFEMISETLLKCRVIDNGIGRKKAGRIKQYHTDEHLSIATGNVEERLDLIGTLQKYKTLVSIIDLENKEGNATGTEVVVVLPILKNVNNQKKYA